MLGLTFSSKFELDCGSYIISIAKTASQKIRALIRSMKFLSPEVAVSLQIYTPMYGILLSRWCPQLLLRIVRQATKANMQTVGPSLAASLEHLAHHQNVASSSLFCRYHFDTCSSELTQLVPLPFSDGRSSRYCDRLHDFSVTIPRCYKDAYLNSSFPRKARVWNSLPIECFPLTYKLNCLKSRINIHLFTMYLLCKEISCMLQLFCASYSCNSMPCNGCSASHRVNPN